MDTPVETPAETPVTPVTTADLMSKTIEEARSIIGLDKHWVDIMSPFVGTMKIRDVLAVRDSFVGDFPRKCCARIAARRLLSSYDEYAAAHR